VTLFTWRCAKRTVQNRATHTCTNDVKTNPSCWKILLLSRDSGSCSASRHFAQLQCELHWESDMSVPGPRLKRRAASAACYFYRLHDQQRRCRGNEDTSLRHQEGQPKREHPMQSCCQNESLLLDALAIKVIQQECGSIWLRHEGPLSDLPRGATDCIRMVFDARLSQGRGGTTRERAKLYVVPHRVRRTGGPLGPAPKAAPPRGHSGVPAIRCPAAWVIQRPAAPCL